ncbi:hypothetical protein UFOVP75_63 [uncultured Caudovirales phage]|uniref:Uncharacterized protein n=1 Tax=uncultured Caudovirales phage TaxID=2100421 RepID=A0A6J5L0G8_9CAUD|nr:hypothetical protein UFOVP75_63 [uncultured Caudovirales phage]
MATPKVLTGARAIVSIGINGSTPQTVGVFSSITYSAPLDAQGAWILGRFSAAEIDYTAAELVNITCSGWRVLNHGIHAESQMPTLAELLTKDYLTISVFDRATGVEVAKFENCRAVGNNGGFTSKQLSEISITFVGILASDETGKNVFTEDGTASDLPA